MSNGTFAIVNVDDITERDDMVTVLINYKANKGKLSMLMRGDSSDTN
ncbi:hypothetical protein OQX63_05820 [Pedobacter sp. PF22-3]|nr:hypothetical protein [Pedobacter sp. PF22-3]MCX2492980.1 hypothetical protein [Pedobacter sp. PF22-3]